MESFSRRQFGAISAAATWGAMARPLAAEEPAADVAFFLIGDTHYLANKEAPGEIDAVSAGMNARLIAQLNRLPGTEIPAAAGAGTVAVPRGVIHAGDLIDTGDKHGELHSKMQATEWATYVADFGLTGSDGQLKYPVYEVHGNHDSPSGDGLVIRELVARNKHRVGVTHVSKNGLHYAWDWGPLHLVNLGIVVGAVPEVARKRRYNPLDSLEFLTADLAANVGDSGRPVVLTHHVDVARYSTPPDPDGPATNAEWDPCDVHGYFAVLQQYNVIAILYGHTHARNIFRWAGTPRPAEAGVAVFNVDNSAHFGSQVQGLLYFHVQGTAMTVRELATKDGWQTAAWTPQTWKYDTTPRPQG